MAGPLKPIPLFDLSGGENTVASPYVLGRNQSQRVVNFILDEHGSLRVRDGMDTLTTIGTTDPIAKMETYTRSNSAAIRLAIARATSPALNRLWNWTANPPTDLGALASSTAMPDIVLFNNEAIITEGNTVTLNSYDATAITQLTGGAPPSAHIANHLNYLWGWNTNPTTAGIQGPSSLRSSDLNNQNSWPAASQTFIARDDGQQGQGLGLFTIAETGISPEAVLIAFKDFSLYQVSGVFGATAFAVQKVKSDMGCVAPRTIQFLAGFGMMRLTHRGFALYDGVNDTLVSEEIRPRIFGRDDITPIDWSQVAMASATQVANPPLYVCSCPVTSSSGALRRVFVYDLVRRAWTINEYPNDQATLALILEAGTLPIVVAGGYTGGVVYELFGGDATDDGTDISWLVRTRGIIAGSPSERMYVRRMLAKFYDIPEGTTVQARFYASPTAPITQKIVEKTVPIVTPIAPFLGYGLSAWGLSPYGAPVTENVTDVDLNFDVGLKCNAIIAELSGTSAGGRLRGIEFHVRQMPLTTATLQRN